MKKHPLGRAAWALFAGLFIYAPACVSAEQGWYGGFSGGTSTMDLDVGDWDDGTLAIAVLENDSTAYKVFTGYRFNQRFWVEVNALRLAESEMIGESSGGLFWTLGPIAGKVKANGVSVSGIVAQPLWSGGDVFAKAGMLAWDSVTTREPTVSGRFKTNNDGVDLTFGVGAEVRVYRRLRLRGEWEYFNVGFAGGLDTSVTVATLGILSEF